MSHRTNRYEDSLAKRLNFSFSVDASVLGAFLADHADNMNIQVFTEEPRPARRKQSLPKGHGAPALPASTGTAASKDSMEALILSLLSESQEPVGVEQITHAVNGAFARGRTLMYAVLKDLMKRGQIERPKLGTYALAKLALPAPGKGKAKNKQTGAQLILDLMNGGKDVSVAEMRDAFKADGRSENSVNDQVGKLVSAKLIASSKRGYYHRTGKAE
jgi:hypothetical protein